MRYELTDLRVFVAIANTKNLTSGARDSNITAPAASYRIKNLEEALGVKLFQRTAKGMEITAAGDAVYRHAQTVLSNLDEMQGDVSRFRHGVVGTIRIHANSSTLSNLSIPMSKFLARYKNVNIDLEEHLSENIVRSVNEGHADLGLTAGAIYLRGLESIVYAHDELVLAVPNDHALAARRSATLDQALQYDLISLGRASSNFLYIQQMASGMRLNLNVRVHVPSFEAVLRCVSEGAGIAIVPKSVIGAAGLKGKIMVRKLDERWATREQRILAKDFRGLPDYTQEFVKYVRDHASAAKPSRTKT